MKKLFISLGLCVCCSFLIAQNTNPIQDAMVNYDYETALSLINQEEPTIPLLYQKGRALKGLGNNLEALEVFRRCVEETGIRLIDKAPRKGAEGLNIAFLHPKSTLGVLTELCEKP